MQNFKTCLLALFLLTFSWTIALGQEVDKNLIIGKWKFVKTTVGPHELAYQYNGDPLLTFEKNGNWITEDINPKYKQSGSWKTENNILVRDPKISGLGDIGPYPRVIEKLTQTELVMYASTEDGARTITFYFIRLE